MKWIRVEDELPVNDDEIIVYDPDGDPAVHGDIFYELPQGYFRDHSFIENKEITHWMPLPEPPEDE